MRSKLLIATIVLLAFLSQGSAGAYYGESNLLTNPGYEDNFAGWQNDGFSITTEAVSGVKSAKTIVVKGSPAILCSKPYKSNRSALHLQVSFKSQGQATNFRAGRGTGLFMVRWLDENQNLVGDTVMMTTDNARKGWQRVVWTNPYFDEDATDNIQREWFQICARAYAFGDRPFTLWVDDWSAEQ